MIARKTLMLAAALGALFVLLALARPVDHDESQYVAAAVLAWHGVPYRDFAYLQTPLQPLLLAPVAALAGAWAWPVLRLVNAGLGLVTVLATLGAARAAGASGRAARTAAMLMATCDILLFSIGTARNDALPAALLALGLWLAVVQQRDGASAGRAWLAGLLLAAAAMAKISYALPAAAYGLWSLAHPRHRPWWVAAGAVPMLALFAVLYAAAPAATLFGVLDFPARAPAEYYAAAGRAARLSLGLKIVDIAKFLLLGPAALALVIVARSRWRGDAMRTMLAVLMGAALIAAALPTPSWRQYLLPVLPMLFVWLALVWTAAPPGRGWRIAGWVFAAAGLAPSAVALAQASAGLPMIAAMRDGQAIRAAMNATGVGDGVATLSPQFLPATGRLPDPRFATGPFYFRSHHLIDVTQERAFWLVSRDRLAAAFAAPADRPSAILVGGEGRWTSGDDRLDTVLEAEAQRLGWRRIDVAGTRFRLYVPTADQAAARRERASSRP